MNQILDIKQRKRKLRIIFKIQFIVSLVAVVIGFIYFYLDLAKKSKENDISNIIALNAKLNSVFSGNIQDNIYLGKIKIEKIDLDYFVYNTYSDELLKVLPCKFSGGNLNEPRKYLYYRP